MTTPNNLTDFGRDLFAEQPEFALLGALGASGQPRRVQDFFRQRTGPLLSRFNQILSQQILQGQLPDANPFDFFSGQTEFPFSFGEEFARVSPAERGSFSRLVSPSTRFIFNR